MDTIDKFLELNRERRLSIYCIGDAMVDEYYNGVVDRISAEIPMSIMTSTELRPVRRPGGVANVAYQLKNFNVDTKLVSFIDARSAHVFYEHHLNLDTSISTNKLGQGHIPVKKRFLANGIQVFRHDVERPNYGLSDEEIDTLQDGLFDLLSALPVPDMVILSDYNKGFYSINAERSYADKWNWFFRHGSRAMTIVDPKVGAPSNWAGCSIFKPNYKEAREMTGEKEPMKQLEALRRCGLNQIAITLGGDGVAGWDGKEFFHYKPSRKVVVESNIGAGDCCVALLGMATAYGMPLQEAVEVAYRGGEIYVQNRLNRPVVPAELSVSKIVQPSDLVNRDFKLVFTNGCFDILHPGHFATLDFAKSKGDKLVVALNSDASVKRLKGPSRPINELDKRLQIVSRLDMVDFVMSFDEDTPIDLIKGCKPDVLVKGNEGKPVVGQDIVPEVYLAPFMNGESTSAILNRIQQR